MTIGDANLQKTDDDNNKYFIIDVLAKHPQGKTWTQHRKQEKIHPITNHEQKHIESNNKNKSHLVYLLK
jgi:hypothetical protein